MKFNGLQLRNFRNFSEQQLELHPGLNVFRGQNGQGKTNFVEALYLLTHGSSFRTSRPQDLIQKEVGQGFYLRGHLEKAGLSYEIEMMLSSQGRRLRVNQQSTSSPRLRKDFTSLLFSPESLLIVKESPQRRRDLIDDLSLSLYPEFAQLLVDYRKLLKQKNGLLKNLRDGAIDRSQGLRLNENLTQLLFEKGSRICAIRCRAIESIEPFLLEEFLKIMDEHYGNLSLEYLISGEKIAALSETQALNAMYKRWETLKDRELASGAALVGPHKHDIRFIFNGQEARFYCSQGQQRAIVLAFKMAQTRLHYRAHNEYPILLLDDVLSELDGEKQTRFVNYLLSTEAQIFLTTTDATILPHKAESVVFDVKEGRFVEKDRLLTGGLSV